MLHQYDQPEGRNRDESRRKFFIDRMVSQARVVSSCAALTQTLTGPVLELGLGNGRRFNTSGETLPERDIFVFTNDPPVGVYPR